MSEGSPFNTVELRCRADVGGHRIVVTRHIDEVAYQDPFCQKVVEEALRADLMRAILDVFKPKIYVSR